MDKKIQKSILAFVKEFNCEVGAAYTLLYNKLFEKFVDNDKVCTAAALLNNIKFLLDEKKIECSFAGEDRNIPTSIRITALGYHEFDPWYKKIWNFFTNDLAKILSVIATILSITATIISLNK